MVLQAFIDESYDDDSGIFVMAGCIATAAAWAQFSKEWQKMLPKWGVLDKHGNYHFHLQEMTTPERKRNVSIFFDTLYRYSLGFISVKINRKELKRAQARISVPNMNIDWAYSADPYFLSLHFMIDKFQQVRAEMQDYFSDKKVDFYFDNHIDKKIIISSWEDNLKRKPEETKKYYGATPRFEDDKVLLPLQGADLIAGLIRRGYMEGKSGDEIAELDVLGITRTIKKETIRIVIEYNEDEITSYLKQALRYVIGPKRPIYDVKIGACTCNH